MDNEKTRKEFTPQLTGFYCIYCGYMAADTAGIKHIQYPASAKFFRLPCTGKLDIRYILEAFEQGADGVYIVACPIGNCHHVRGNERGQARLKRAKALIESIGLEPERLEIFFMSGSQGHAFAMAAQTMTERIKNLGPNPLRMIDAGSNGEPPDEDDFSYRGRRGTDE
mgnify:CR=1 FL=1